MSFNISQDECLQKGTSNRMGPGNGPEVINDLKVNCPHLLGREDVKRRNGPIYFAFASFFCKKVFVGKVLKYAIKGFSHEILHNVTSSLKYAKKGLSHKILCNMVLFHNATWVIPGHHVQARGSL